MGSSPVTKKLLFTVLALALALALAEAASRAVEAALGGIGASHTPAPHNSDAPPPGRPRGSTGGVRMIPHPTRRWTLPPRSVVPHPALVDDIRVSSMGIRGGELPPFRAGELRVMALGDSSIFADGVAHAQTFVGVAASALSRCSGQPVLAINAGVPGYDSTQSATLLKELGPLVRPTFVVVANLWSDIYNNEKARDLRVDRLGPRPPLGSLASYRLLYRALTPWLRPLRVGFIASDQDIGSTKRGGAPTRTPLPRYLANLEQMARQATALGARPVFLQLPAPMDYAGPPVPETVQDFRAAMVHVAARHGAPVVDGPASMRGLDQPAGLFFDQVHPNAKGHGVLGRAVGRALCEAAARPRRGE